MLLVAIAVIFIAAYALEGYLFCKLWGKGLEITVGFNKNEYVRGETGFITETVANRKRMPLPLLLVSFSVDSTIVYKNNEKICTSDRNYRSDCLAIHAKEAETRDYEVTFTNRGVFSIGDVNLYTSNLFMNRKGTGKVSFNDEIYVYPKRMEGIEIQAVVSHLTGEYLNHRFIYEDPFEFKGIRNYVHTDPMKKINWNAFAKTGELKVNEYYDTRGLDVTIYLNLEPEGVSIRRNLIEAAIEIARTVFEDMLRQGIPVRLITNAVDSIDGNVVMIDEGAGIGHGETCLRMLARIDGKKYSEGFEDILEREAERKKEDSLYVLISVCQKKSLVTAFEEFLRDDTGEMIVPLNASMPRRIASPNVNATYVEVDA